LTNCRESGSKSCRKVVGFFVLPIIITPLASPDDIYVSPSPNQIVWIKIQFWGQFVHPKTAKVFCSIKVISVSGKTTEQIRDRVPFEYLTPLFPEEKLHLSTKPEMMSTRVLLLLNWKDRGMIVAQPKTGKTVY
jgi:transcription termination factor Rho